MDEQDDTPPDPQPESIFGMLAGTVVWFGDLISPTGEKWDADE